MAAGDRIFMAKESTSQEILSNTKKIIEDERARIKSFSDDTEKIRNENQPPRQQSGNPCQISL